MRERSQARVDRAVPNRDGSIDEHVWMNPARHSSVAYRPDIDGLRGIAVIAVVLYHAFPSLVPGGFMGVDVFFVISGFLISSIILEDLRQGRFLFARFYAARIRRIFPALIVVLASCLFLAAGLFLGTEFRNFSRHVAGASGFVSNFLLWQESGYFDAEALTKPLLHLWSLGIEEQFYLVWPLVLFLAWRRRPLLLSVIALVLLGSFALNVQHIAADPTAVFFSPITRFWELAIGAAIAAASLFHPSAPPTAPMRAAPIASRGTFADALAGLCAIAFVFAFLGLNQSIAFPGWWALLPTLATAALIVLPPTTHVHRHFLASRPIVAVGLISYPLYLWHWPLISFAHVVGNDSREMRMALVAASAVLAYLTYRLVEYPIRFGTGFRRAKIIALVSLMGAIGIIGLFGSAGLIRPFFNDDNLKAFENDRQWTYINAPQLKPVAFGPRDFAGAEALRQNLDLYSPRGIFFFRAIPSASKKKVLYFGDSQMEQFWPRIDELIRQNPSATRTAVFLTASAFMPIPDVHYDPEVKNPHFTRLANTMVSYALSDADIDTVVIAAAWRGHFHDGDIRNSDSAESVYYTLVDGRKEHLSAGRRANDVALEHLTRMLRTLVSGGKRVFLILDIPGHGRIGIRRTWGKYELAPLPFSKEDSLTLNGNIRGQLQRAARLGGAEVIDPYLWLCPKDSCPVVYDGDRAVYMNPSHLADPYVRRYATFMDRTATLP
jgi:peptidoglycan/LPS O-acetylase OafA/YrhL